MDFGPALTGGIWILLQLQDDQLECFIAKLQGSFEEVL